MTRYQKIQTDMISLHNKTTILIFLLLLNVLIIYLAWEQPALRNLQSTMEIYREALNDSIPSITVLQKGISLQGKLPTRIFLKENISINFDVFADSAEFMSYAPRSLWLSNDVFMYRTKKGITTFNMQNISTGDPPRTFTGKEIREKISRYYQLGKILIVLTLLLLTFTILLLLMLFGGGVGIMIDAFKEGPFTYSQMLNLSAIMLTVWIVILTLAKKMTGIFSLKILIIFFILYLFSVILLANWKIQQNKSMISNE